MRMLGSLLSLVGFAWVVLPFVLCLSVSGPAQAAGFSRSDLLVTDYQNDRVLVIHPGTGVLSVLSPAPGAALNNLNHPMGITVTSDGTVYVVNSGDNHLVQIEPLTGDQLVIQVYVPGIPIGHFEPLYIGQIPMSVRADASDDLYVASSGSYEVRKITGLGTSGVNSVQLVQDATLQQVSDLLVNGTLLKVSNYLTGVWQVPVTGGSLTKRADLISGNPLRLFGLGLDTTSEIGVFHGPNTPSGDCELADAGVYKLVHFQPVPGSPGYDSWVPQSMNAATGIGPYACPTSLVVVDDTTFFVGQYDTSGGWISKVVTGSSSNVTRLATLPDGPGPAFPGAMAIAPVSVPEPGLGSMLTASVLALAGLARRNRRG